VQPPSAPISIGRDDISPQPPPGEPIPDKEGGADRAEISPLELLINQQERDFQQHLVDRLLVMEPRDFERLGERLARALGFTDVEVTQYTNDGGVDVFGSLELGIVKVRGAFQMKRWRNTVGKNHINNFRGAIQGRYDQGIFVTTSVFTDSAKELASIPGAVPVIMIDRERLTAILTERGLGVTSEPVTIKKIDDTFFDELKGV
jgi:restriction system protein